MWAFYKNEKGYRDDQRGTFLSGMASEESKDSKLPFRYMKGTGYS